jgi:hypothetical protein
MVRDPPDSPAGQLLALGASLLDKPVTDSWFGFPSASAEQVAAARLGCVLPPSLCEFLTSDGWQQAGYFGGEVRGAGELGRLRDLYPMLAGVYDDDADQHGAMWRMLMISEGADAGVLFPDPGDVDEHGEWAAYELYSWSGEGPQRRGSFAELVCDLHAGFRALKGP